MRKKLEHAVVACARGAMNAAYAACDLFPRRNEVVFVSRRTDEPSYDFRAVGQAFEGRGYRAVYLTKKLSKRSAFGYLFHALREVYHLARCRACFVDRYDPVICLLNLQCQQVPLAAKDRARGAFDMFPVEPVVVQIWHAFGAFKKFGYQSHDTLEGHALAKMDLYRIHRNYSRVLCSGEGARQAFAEAFRCPVDRVVALPRPEYDEFKQLAIAAARNRTGPVLFAPTLRICEESQHPFRELQKRDEWRALEELASVEWAFHPLEQKGVASGAVSDSLLHAQMVVTDYSSIAYEAYLLGKPTVFYVPDIKHYRCSPGLNSDPFELCPELSFTRATDLIRFVGQVVSGKREYPWSAFDRFACATLDEQEGGATGRLLGLTLEWISEGQANNGQR